MVGMLIVGGIGTLSGPVIGTLVFMALPELLRVAKFYRLVILGVVIVLAVLFMPDGIAGFVRRRFRRSHLAVTGTRELGEPQPAKALSGSHSGVAPR